MQTQKPCECYICHKYPSSVIILKKCAHLEWSFSCFIRSESSSSRFHNLNLHNWNGLHCESIETLWRFSHFDMLQSTASILFRFYVMNQHKLVHNSAIEGKKNADFRLLMCICNHPLGVDILKNLALLQLQLQLVWVCLHKLHTSTE